MDLILEIEKRVLNKLKEDARQDKRYRQKVINLYEDLLEYLQSGNEFDFLRRPRVKGKRVSDVNLPDDSLRIEWAERDGNKSNAIYTVENGTPIIRLHVLDRIARGNEEKQRSQMIRGLKNNAQLFMHEFTHYLDDQRIDKDLEDLAQYDLNDLDDMGDSDTYFQDPLETNAYFQAALSQVQAIAEEPSILKYQVESEWNKSFRGFKEWFFRDILGDPVVNNITDDQRKRMINRLYGYWKMLVEDYEDVVGE